MNSIATGSREQRLEVFAATADRMRVSEAITEKDFWVCWVLMLLFTDDAFRHRLLFKGGTSLSKVFGVIHRFSEDIDLAVDYQALGFTGERDPQYHALSNNRRNRLLKEMQLACQGYIVGEFVPAFRARVTSVLGETDEWSVQVDELDPHKVLFRYPPAAVPNAYIPSQVILELGTHAEFVPHDSFPIRAFVAEKFPDLIREPEIWVKALLAERTFWEKATILHAEFHRSPEKELPPRYSRHYYDLAMMARGPVRDRAVSKMDLLADVVRHKKIFYASGWAHYDTATPGSLQLLPAASRVDVLRRDYAQMKTMIFGEPPTFESVLGTIGTLQEQINS
jgi:hypothetical protein